MISVVYGVPGSGKTYYSVHWIKKRALEEGDIFLRVKDNTLLITNLRLNLDSMDNYIYIEDIKDFAKYMDVDFWRANLQRVQGKRILFVMDECQLFFYHFKDDAGVLFFLQYHRHLSVDILLITQTPKSLPAKVFELSEFLIEAVPKSVNPFGWKAFRYRVLHPFDRDVVLRRFHLAFDPVVFYLYSDMIYKPSEDEGEKPRNAFIRYYVLLGSFLFLTVFLMFSFFARFSSPLQAKSQPSPSPSPAVQSQQVIQYEDLITDEKPKQESPKPSDSPKPSESPKSSDSPKPSDIPKPSEGSYHLAIIKPAQDSPKDVLNPSVKVIEIP